MPLAGDTERAVRKLGRGATALPALGCATARAMAPRARRALAASRCRRRVFWRTSAGDAAAAVVAVRGSVAAVVSAVVSDAAACVGCAADAAGSAGGVC